MGLSSEWSTSQPLSGHQFLQDSDTLSGANNISTPTFYIPISIETFTNCRPKRLINIGGILQGVAAFSFGFLEYVDNTTAFLGLSYFLRFLDGMGDAAAWGAIISIMMKLYPDKVSTIMSWTEMAFGLGYSFGKSS
jgi:MFS family permease